MTTKLTKLALRVSAVALTVASTFLVSVRADAEPANFIHPDWVDGCKDCPLAARYFNYVVVDPQGPVEINRIEAENMIATAMEQLLNAARTVNITDLTPSNDLVSPGIAGFDDAAKLAGNGTFLVAGDWDGDYCGNGTVPPKPLPPGPLDDADRLIAEGLTGLGQAAQTDDPAQAAEVHDAAADDLLKAAQLLSQG